MPKKRLGLESFEERAVPSAAIAEPPHESESAVVREVSARSDSTSSRVGLIPLGYNRDGNLVILLVYLNPNTVSSQTNNWRTSNDRSEPMQPMGPLPPAAAATMPSDPIAESVARVSALLPGNSAVNTGDNPTPSRESFSNAALPNTPFIRGNYANLSDARTFLPIAIDNLMQAPSEGMGPAEIPPPDEMEPTPMMIPSTGTESGNRIIFDELPLAPLTGLLPLNLGILETGVRELLTQVESMKTEWVENFETSDAWWLGAAALTAGGAVVAARSAGSPKATQRRARPFPTWEE